MKIFQYGVTGIALSVLSIGTASAQQNTPITQAGKSTIITKAMTMLQDNYIFPDRVAAINNYVKQKLSSGGYDGQTKSIDFLEALNDDLKRQGKDRHLSIYYGPDRVKQIIADTKNEKGGKEQVITPEWMQKLRFENFRLKKLENMDGNIGYFKFLNFTSLAASKLSITGAMNFLRYSSAIIIDLTENHGGEAETMNFMLSYFLKDSTQVAEFRYRKDHQIVKTFTAADSAIHKIPEDVPLYILVSGKTSSAAEAFTYTLQQYKRATIIGTQTKGEGNPGRLFIVNDDLYMMIPTAEGINPVSKKSIDGIGVIPDINIAPAKTLTMARLLADSVLAVKSKNAGARQLYQWQIPALQNELNPVQLSPNIISSVIGNYAGGRKVLYENADIYYINSRGVKTKLTYFGNGVFENSAETFVRLVMPFTDKPVSFFDWVYDDGGKERIERVKL